MEHLIDTLRDLALQVVKVVDNLLLDRVGLPHVHVLVIDLVHFMGLMGRGDQFKSTTSSLKFWLDGSQGDYSDSVSLKILFGDLSLYFELWTPDSGLSILKLNSFININLDILL